MRMKKETLFEKFKPQVLKHAAPQKKQYRIHIAFGNMFAIITEIQTALLTWYTYNTNTLAFQVATMF